MKPLGILFLICELSLLSACSTPVPELVLLNTPGMPLKLTQIEFPTEEPQSTSVSLQNPSQIKKKNSTLLFYQMKKNHQIMRTILQHIPSNPPLNLLIKIPLHFI